MGFMDEVTVEDVMVDRWAQTFGIDEHNRERRAWTLTFQPGWLSRLLGARPCVATVMLDPTGSLVHVETQRRCPKHWLALIEFRDIPDAQPPPEQVEAEQEVARLLAQPVIASDQSPIQDIDHALARIRRHHCQDVSIADIMATPDPSVCPQCGCPTIMECQHDAG